MPKKSRYDPVLHGPARVVGPGFHERVYALVARIPKGRVSTYGDLAAALGYRNAARQVGWALAAIPADHDGLPWHRVVNAKGLVSLRADGRPGREQAQRLRSEGVELTDGGRVARFADKRHHFGKGGSVR